MNDPQTITPPSRLRRLVWFVVACLPLAGVIFLLARTNHRSYYGVFFTPAGRVQGIAAHRGQAMVSLSHLSLGAERGLTVLGDAVVPEEFDPVYEEAFNASLEKREHLHFGIARRGPPNDAAEIETTTLTCPLWALAIVAGIPPLRGSTNALKRRRRRKKGLCVECGYDLRATTGTVCPECGVRISAPSGAAALAASNSPTTNATDEAHP